MKITRLQLENFRNYTSHDYIFPQNKELIIFIGDNGKGKTNLLESLYILSLGRSFRTIENENMIHWGQNYFRCKADVFYEDESTSLEVFYAKAPSKLKNFKKNSANLTNSAYIGNLLTVLFHPEDLNMLYLSPSYRRRYMDILLSQVDKKYLSDLSNYKKILKQRSALLHKIRDSQFKRENIQTLLSDLDVWDIQLIGFGISIIDKRKNLIEFFNERLSQKYKIISGKEQDCYIEYKSKEVEGREKYEERLKDKRFLDIRNAKTNIGPHVDDLVIFIDGKEILKSASRGEFRTILLAMKLIEIELIRQRTGLSPLLLLDDVFSELDKKRQKHLFSAINGCQTIITTTNAYDIQGLTEQNENIEVVNMA